MVRRDKVIKIRVTESEKDEMRDFIENELHYSGFSDYFRTRVYEDMRDGDGVDIDIGEIVDGVSDEIGGLKDSVGEMESMMSQLMGVVEDMQGDISSLSSELYEVLPTEDFLNEHRAEYEQMCTNPFGVTRSDDLRTKKLMSTSRTWSIHFGERESRIETALYALKSDMPDVKSKTNQTPSGEVEFEVYYKEGE